MAERTEAPEVPDQTVATDETAVVADGPRGESLQVLEQQIGILVRRIKRVIGDRAQVVHEELQPASYLMLAWLADSGPVRPSAMVEQFQIDKGAVSRQLQHLVDLGLVDKVADPDDGRASLVTASADARRRLEDMRIHRRKWLDERLGDWGDDELAGFGEMLHRYNTALD